MTQKEDFMTELPSQRIMVARRTPAAIRVDAQNSAPWWQSAEPVRFNSDWKGENHDRDLETEVRVLWSAEMLYLRFVCRYQTVFVFDDSESNGRRDHLWDRDVAEAFLQPPDSIRPGDPAARSYKEFEVAPNGMWIDLDISPSGLADLSSGMGRSVHINEKGKIWTAELAIPIQSLTRNFDPNMPWRANFYRVEGNAEPRRYMAWQPTHTPEPNFHVPESFGVLRFSD
jgi:alpha-galactosidase